MATGSLYQWRRQAKQIEYYPIGKDLRERKTPEAQNQEKKKNQQKMVQGEEIRKGPWTEQEDVQLVLCVNVYGDRRWDFIAKVSGLKVLVGEKYNRYDCLGMA